MAVTPHQGLPPHQGGAFDVGEDVIVIAASFAPNCLKRGAQGRETAPSEGETRKEA